MKNKQISVTSTSFSFNGYAGDAHEFVIHIQKIHNELSIDIPKDLNDFIFEIEVELQNVGYLDENFDINSD
jgi:hypothetical protein